jgi:hypothetical protein
MPLPSSAWNQRLRNVAVATYFFHPDDGGQMFIRNVGIKQKPHGITSQYTPSIVVTAEEMSNLKLAVIYPSIMIVQIWMLFWKTVPGKQNCDEH